MARAARTASVILAVLAAVALTPAAAGAAINGSTVASLPSSVTVGTSVQATITITNLDDAEQAAFTNKVCDPPDENNLCSGAAITLVPACSQVFGQSCGTGAADPGVFSFAPQAAGSGPGCSGAAFTVSTIDAPTGTVRFSSASDILLAGNGASCTITVTAQVLGVPTADLDPMAPGTQTAQIASADQVDNSMFKLGATRSTRQVFTNVSTTTVNPAQPTIATVASPGIAVGSGSISDTATVSGRVNPQAGAHVEFLLFAPGDDICMAPISTTEAPLSAEGTATSSPIVPPQPGTYRWIARYLGDANNAAVSGLCNDPGESVVVTAAVTPPPPPPPPVPPRAQPVIVTTATPAIMVGGRLSATATLSGHAGPVAGATVQFRLYGPDVPECAGTPIFSATVAVDDAGVATSPQFAPLTGGTYRWVATYGGDAANLPVASACDAPVASVDVTPLPPKILSAGFATPPRVGVPTLLTIGAFDPTRPISGVQVRFGEPRGLSGISACKLGAIGMSLSPVLLQVPYTFREPGRHVITITILSGGCGSALHRTTTTIEVVVAAAAARSALRAASGSRCANTLVVPTTAAASRRQVAAAILCLVNAERTKLKRKKLRRSARLEAAALGHSKDMIKRKFFEHAGPGGPSFQARLTRIRYRGRTAAENIGYGSTFNAKLIVDAWLHSPPHKANILAPQLRFAGVGVGVMIPLTPQSPGSTYTMDFGATLQ
ncbi:MAG: hypothetical protein QOJ35_2420 [Solirubrobacteraceae bacterium]|jgi:uncharacterized protein YkwD|nr:hypothetical protein [Solirubrobacteraceae bacterium]